MDELAPEAPHPDVEPAAREEPAAGGGDGRRSAPVVTRGSVVRVVLLAMVGIGVVAIAVHEAGASVRSALEGLVDIHLWWVPPLLAAQAVSMASIGRQQRSLVAPSTRHRPGMRSVLRTTYASNAISVSLPLAGPGLATAFTYRRYTRAGARPGEVATGLAVSGVVSLSAFVAIIGVAAVASGRTALLVGGLNALALSAVPVAVLAVVLRSAPLRARSVAPLTWVLRLVQRVARRPRGDAGALVVSALHQLARAEMRPGQVARATVFAVLTAAADIATLGFALAAVGAPVTPSSAALLVLAWAAGVTAAGIGLVPGGVGVVELTMTAVMTAAGIPLAAALSGVLLYRIVAFWLVLAVGWVLVAVAVRRPPAASAT